MPRALRIRLTCVCLAILLLLPAAAYSQIAGGTTFNFSSGEVHRNNLAYDPVNQVYLAIVAGSPVTGRFLTKTGTPIGADFQISFEPLFVGWVSIAFGGPANDPAFLVTYLAADDVLNPKYGRLVRFNSGSPIVGPAIWIANTTTAWYAAEKALSVWNGQTWVIGSRVNPPGWSLPGAQVNLLDINGNLSGPVIIGDGADHYGAPSLACAANGVCVVVGYMSGIPMGHSGGTYAQRFNGTSLAPLGGLFYPSTSGPNEDQGVVYQTHTGMFLAAWFRGGGAGYIDTRRIGTDGSMTALDLSRGIGPGAGANAIAFNQGTLTSLLVTKRAPDAALIVMELGNDGYPVNQANTVLVTPWDGVPDYWPSVAVNTADRQWLTTAVRSTDTIGKFIQTFDPWVDNGTFTSGLTGWSTFGLPTSGDLVAGVSGGVLSFYRQPAPPGTTGQGTVFQAFGVGVAASTTMTATFQIGNSSSVRKRLTVLLHDLDFSDLQMCTFWLEPSSPLRDYRMNTHANQAWDNVTLSFYAATSGSDGGAYLLDNVAVYPTSNQVADRTECVDPTTPGTSSYPDSNNLIVNGDFQGGLAPWTVFGQITYRIQGGVFEFGRPAGTPAGVVMQATGIGGPSHARLTLTARLGNSSSARKRVTVLVHDSDFSDFSACTFWLSPSAALATYSMKFYTTKAWTNATVSIYPATQDSSQTTRLDDVSLRVTMTALMNGTDCIEPGVGVGGETLPEFSSSTLSSVAAPPVSLIRGNAAELPLGAVLRGSELGTFVWPAPLDLSDAIAPVMRFESHLSDALSDAVVEVTRDGLVWERLAVVPPSDGWTGVSVDLRQFAGSVVYVRFVLTGAGEPRSTTPATWAIRAISVDVHVAPVTRSLRRY